jgi:hypothetical protein
VRVRACVRACVCKACIPPGWVVLVSGGALLFDARPTSVVSNAPRFIGIVPGEYIFEPGE